MSTQERFPMQRRSTLASVAAAVGITISACSSDYAPTGYGAPMTSAAASDGAPTLTVMNFLNWCSVAINGGPASTAATVAASVTPGSVVTIVATPASSSFEIGTDPWFGVDQN